MCRWIVEDNGEVAVYDATNTTYDRRKMIYEVIVEKYGYKLFFVESICNSPEIIEANIKVFFFLKIHFVDCIFAEEENLFVLTFCLSIQEVKVHSPDYLNMDEEQAVKDFMMRIEHYKRVYQTLDEEKEKSYSFMQVFNAGEKVLVHRHEGHIQSRVVYYLMNIHITPRSIYLTRHGESVYNLMGRIGGDSDLSERGVQYAHALGQYITDQKIPSLRVWTSQLKRTIQTAEPINASQERWKALDEINAGICEEMTYEEIQEKFPKEFALRDQDKFHYRYPKGEVC